MYAMREVLPDVCFNSVGCRQSRHCAKTREVGGSLLCDAETTCPLDDEMETVSWVYFFLLDPAEFDIAHRISSEYSKEAYLMVQALHVPLSAL